MVRILEIQQFSGIPETFKGSFHTVSPFRKEFLVKWRAPIVIDLADPD